MICRCETCARLRKEESEARRERETRFLESVAAKAAAAGFPGLLPCLVGECRNGGTIRYHAPDDVDVVEPQLVRERCGVRIPAAKKSGLSLACKGCQSALHWAGVFLVD